jgi:5-formyltetrahydrofolate cyclo-ligase
MILHILIDCSSLSGHMVQKKKEEVRKKMMKQRNALSEEERKELDAKIGRVLFEEEKFKKARAVAIYRPIATQVDTKEITLQAQKQKKEILIPVTNHEIELFRFTGFDKLKKGKYGILEPTERIASSMEPDVVVIPGIAFGLCMHRIGYGKGYYDKLLRTLASYRIGICHDFQVMEKLPSHEDDERMDLIITDKRRIALV